LNRERVAARVVLPLLASGDASRGGEPICLRTAPAADPR